MTQSMFGMLAPSVKIASPFQESDLHAERGGESNELRFTRIEYSHPEDRRGLPIVCATGFRTHSRASGRIGAPDLSSQVCTTNEIQRLGVDDARQIGGVVIPGGRVDGHILEICLRLDTRESRVA